MSRIGKKVIELPAKVKVTISGEGAVNAEGPKGKLAWTLPKQIKGRVDGTTVHIERSSEDRKVRALHGLSRALVNNIDQRAGQTVERTHLAIFAGTLDVDRRPIHASLDLLGQRPRELALRALGVHGALAGNGDLHLGGKFDD